MQYVYINLPILFAIPETRLTVYLVEKHDDLAQFKLVENADVIQRWHSQDGDSQLLPQHAASSTAQATQEPCCEP